MSWLPLTLLCAFAVASADAASKRFLSSHPPAGIGLVRLLVPAVLLSPLLFTQNWGPLPLPFWGWLALAIPLELLGMTLYMRAITISPLALTLPYLALTPVLAAALGWLLLGERMSATGLAGIALVAAGAWTLNAHRARRDGRLELLGPLRATLAEPGSRLMLVVAGLYGFTSVIGKALLAYLPATLLGPCYYAALGGAALVGLLLWSPAAVGAMWRTPGPCLLVGACCTVEVLTHFAALAQVETAYMLAVKRTSLLIGIGYGALLFGEKRLAQHLGAGGLMVAGVALILLH